MTSPQRLKAELPLVDLPQLAVDLCAHLGGAFELERAAREERVTQEPRQGGNFTVEVKRVELTDGAVVVSTQGEAGDNGGTDSRVWEGWFHAEAAITGLPGGAALHFTGEGWGGHTVNTVAIKAADPAALLTFLTAWMEAR